eukprot:5812793-Pleurochrysis_carterae.AAC.1
MDGTLATMTPLPSSNLSMPWRMRCLTPVAALTLATLHGVQPSSHARAKRPPAPKRTLSATTATSSPSGTASSLSTPCAIN